MTESESADPDEGASSRWKLWAGGLASVVVVALGWTVYRWVPVQDLATRWVVWLDGLGWFGAVVYAGFYVVASLFFVPASPLTFGAGYSFGIVWGTLLVSASTTTAAALSFLITRCFAHDWVRSWADDYPVVEAIDRALERESFKVVSLIRMVPVIPFPAVNYAFGVTSIRFRPYVVGSWLGMFPLIALYIYLGSITRKMTALAAGRSGDELPVWAVGETLRRLAAGDWSAAVVQNLVYWLGFAATVGVVTLVTRRAREEFQRITGETEDADLE